MDTIDVGSVIERIATGEFDQEDVDLLMRAYEPLISKYVTILTGHFTSTAGKNFLADDNVRLFAYAFQRGGNVEKTLYWVVTQCRRYTTRELRAEVVRSFLECIIYRGWMREFPNRLAQNIRQLLGNPLDVLVPEVHISVSDPALSNIDRLTLAEEIFTERGIVLTFAERRVIRALSEDFHLTRAAKRLGMSKQNVSQTLRRLRRKAQV